MMLLRDFYIKSFQFSFQRENSGRLGNLEKIRFLPLASVVRDFPLFLALDEIVLCWRLSLLEEKRRLIKRRAA